MKAIIQTKYGTADDLRLQEVERPVPKDDEVLVKVHASSVHADVWHVIYGLPYALRLMGAGLRRPKNPIPGSDIAGVVESVGKNVRHFKPGDAVFGETHRGMQWVNGGAYAEYVSVPEDVIAHKPTNATFEAAASVPTSGYIALLNLRQFGRLRAGTKVLINGAGGAVGTIAVQISKAFGAYTVAVDRAEKLPMLLDLGADQVIDYTKNDITKMGDHYDLIFDVPSNRPFSEMRRALSPEGIYVMIGHDHFGKLGRRVLGSIPAMFRLVAMSFFIKQLPRPVFSMPAKKEVISILKELLENGKLTPTIDRSFPLAEVPAAIRYLQEERPIGKVVITMCDHA